MEDYKLLKGRKGLPWWPRGYKAACQFRGHKLEHWFRRIPHAAGQLSPCTTTTERCAPRARAP